MKDEKRRYTIDDMFEAEMNAINAKRDRAENMQTPVLSKVDVTPAERKTTYQDLYKAYYEEPINKAEEERRKRAATQVNAIRHFGNAMNAFSNLIFTGKGAPSQTLPQLKDPDLQAYSDKLRAARNQYGEAMIKGNSMDDANYRQDKAQEMTNRQYNDKVDQQNFENELKKNQMLNDADAAEAAAIGNAHKMQTEDEQRAIQNKRADSQLNLGWANHNLSKERLEQERFLYENGYKGSSRRNYAGGGKGDALANGIDAAGNWYTVDTSKLSVKGNVTTLRTIYNKLPEEIRKKYDTDIEHADTKDLAVMYQNAIGDAIEKDKSGKVIGILKDGGYATPYRMMNGGSEAPSSGSWLQQHGFGNSGKSGGTFLENLNKK